MSEFADKIVEYLACPCQIFPTAKSDAEILAAYEKAALEGKKEGYTPLIIVPDETLVEEQLELDEEGPPFALRARRLAEAAEIAPEEFFAEYYEDEDKPEPGPIEGDNVISYFSTHWDYENNRTEELILAKIPTENPWELAVWLPMGGFNSCPLPSEQAAIMKRWYEKYGARPAVVSSNTWEFAVPHPLTDKTEALALAFEHYAFCPDRAEGYARDAYTVGNLADSLMKSKIWFFWWD